MANSKYLKSIEYNASIPRPVTVADFAQLQSATASCASETKDPKPTSVLLDETPRHEVVDEILEDFRMTFSSLEETLAWRLDAELVFLKEKRDHSRKRAGPQRE